MTPPESVILTKSLVKNYSPFKALRGVNLKIRPSFRRRGQDFYHSRRTCLNRARAWAPALHRHWYRVLGLDPQKQPMQVRRRSGYLPGELAFEGNMTVEAGLRYLASLRGKKLDWGYIRSLAERLDLNLKPQFKNLSKGNKQKVGVVQALMHCPELLLLDEPTAGLDPLMQQEVLRMVRQAKADGATVFFSSHIINEVEQVAERVGIIRQGVVVEVAETQALIKRALRRARVRFEKPVQAKSLEGIAGVKILSQDETTIHLQIEGEMDALIKALAKFPVAEFETERPSLEEVFLAYYEK